MLFFISLKIQFDLSTNLLIPVPDHLSPSSNQEMEQLPTSNVRKNRLDALAYRINDWEHEPLSSTTKQSTSVQDKGKKPSTFGKRTELTPTKYSPIKGVNSFDYYR